MQGGSSPPLMWVSEVHRRLSDMVAKVVTSSSILLARGLTFLCVKYLGLVFNDSKLERLRLFELYFFFCM